jgi:leucyl aminopeptidase
MPIISATESPASEILVVGISKVAGVDKGIGALRIQSAGLKLDEKQILKSLSEIGATGARDEILKLTGIGQKLIVTTGLGKYAENYQPETLRAAAGAAARALAGSKKATFSLPHRDSLGFTAIAEGALLGAYAFDKFRGNSKAERKAPLSNLEIHSRFGRDKSILRRSEIISRNTHLVRDLINTPPSHLTPITFCETFRPLAKKLSLKIEILNEVQLKRLGYGGIIGVGQGSANPPRLLHISYQPKQAKKSLSLIGKGITFDTGGLALKPAAGMEAMKSDMSGAAAVCAATLAIAELKIPIRIDAWAPLAENMVSDNATRPSDVIKIYGGKTVEVLNPDAEGRLILADALVRAAEVAKSDRRRKLEGIVDVATLTGAQVVALGTRTSAVMTNDQTFSKRFLDCAEVSGELFWPMPLPEDLRASLDSPVADIANIGERMGGMLVAGLFLKDFVEPEIPWLHLDIAGPAYNEKMAHGYTPVGGTGVALRTLVALAELTARR